MAAPVFHSRWVAGKLIAGCKVEHHICSMLWLWSEHPLCHAGVHIADVTNFVHPATAMDEEASAR
jgi:hypothetical protein